MNGIFLKSCPNCGYASVGLVISSDWSEIKCENPGSCGLTIRGKSLERLLDEWNGPKIEEQNMMPDDPKRMLPRSGRIILLPPLPI